MRRLSLADAPYLAKSVNDGLFVYNGVVASAGSSVVGTVTTAPVDTSGSSLLILAIGQDTAGGPPILSDSLGNTWTVVTNTGGGGNGTTMYSCLSPTVGPGHTFTADTIKPSIMVLGFSGTGAVITGQSATYAQSTSVQPGSVTPTQANQLFVSSLCYNSSTGIAINSGFIIVAEVVFTAAHFGLLMAYKIQTGVAAAENPTWTSPLNDDSAMMVALKR